MNAIALYERNPSSYTTERHLNIGVPNKSVSLYLTVKTQKGAK